VSFSKSEGVGMGAVEAALRDKPVIITDFGGAPEYVKTPYLVPCELQELERDDFLFKKGMHWGKPDPVKLLEFMRDAFDRRVRYMDHTHTKNLVGRDAVLHEFFADVIRGQDEKAHE
jgi:glycosyltransferase involved in cell wall biosynthesis